jgi:hypothetical protein
MINLLLILEKLMAQEQGAVPSPFVMPQDLADLGKKTVDTMIGAQKGFLDAFQSFNQQWLSNINTEATLASEFFAKLASVKSIPDAATACQSYATRQMEILADNSRQLMTASENIMPKLFGNGLNKTGT